MKRRALVTGGAGFIGSHLVRARLADGWQVRVLDDLSTGQRAKIPDTAEFLAGDVRDPSISLRACDGIDTLFHLAARVSIRHSVETFCDDADVNLLGTLQLLKAAAECGVRRFVYVSSMAVYAESQVGMPVSETHPTEPLSPYGISKLAAERYVLMMAPRLSIEPVVLRFFNTFGPGQGYTPYVGVATIFITRILRGEPCVIYGDGEQCRDFTHVSDIVQGCRLAADAPAAVGEVFNLGSGVGTTVNALAKLIQAELGAGTFRHEARDSTELRYSVADISEATRLLGYQPRVRLQDRLSEVVESVRANESPR